MNYARQHGVEKVNQTYFQDFNKELQTFVKRDFSAMVGGI